MKRTLLAVLAVLSLAAVPVVAHHMAEGIVDEEIYAMIDELVADTPHAELDFDSMGGMTEMDIDPGNLKSLEALFDGGLLTYAAMLDGQVTVTIEFDDSRLGGLTIVQIEEEETVDETVDKAALEIEAVTLEEVKAEFR